MTDPIGSMITMIKNASLAEKETVLLPYSKLKVAVAECLIKEGYLKSYSKKTKKNHPFLELNILINENGGKVKEVDRISKPSRRVYMGMKEIRPIKNGHGLAVYSTPKGIMSGKEARKEMVGGELLFTMW